MSWFVMKMKNRKNAAIPMKVTAFITFGGILRCVIFWIISMRKRPPSSGGIGSKFMTPSDTLIIAINCINVQRPCSNADLETTAMPIIDAELLTVSAAVAGLKRLTTA